MADEQKVIVVDFNMTFGSMVIFMIKWVLAAIPALIILSILAAIFGGIIRGCFGSF
jgi:hypothetical protein